jgi:ABC-type lipopolysaccharide export system ATPase subunit
LVSYIYLWYIAKQRLRAEEFQIPPHRQALPLAVSFAKLPTNLKRMKKIDLHTHTIPTISDSHFEFSIEKLKEYVTTMEIDCLAITNHNIFDKTQFEQISSEISIPLLPGIEINLEGGHLLLISENKELEDFSDRCGLVDAEIVSNTDSITVEKLIEIFPDLKKYLLIPHYDKKPIIPQQIINRLNEHISAGEVASIRKFKTCLKETDKLVPVIFSDLRFHNDLDSFSTRQTYIALDEINFSGIRSCFFDKGKVFLSKDDGNELFQATDDGIKISTGLNVVFGERSTGKTFTLDKICNSFENVKYIEQFSLLQNDEEKFENLMSIRHSKLSENFLKEFKEVIDDVIKVDLKQNEIDIEKYLSSLIKFATDFDKADSFSKSILFSESLFNSTPQESLKKVIDSTILLLENIEYRNIIDKHISTQILKNLALDLITEFNKTEELNLRKKWLNELVNNIKDELKFRTNSTSPENLDFYKLVTDYNKIQKFTQVVSGIKSEREIERKEIRGFKIVARTKCYTGASQLKNKSKRKLAFTEAFYNYENSYNFLQCLMNMELEETEFYKYFIDVEYKTLNKHDFPVSGGERSEFNLLHEISDALKHDLLLLDEPESSFDNIFLRTEVNELIKDIAKEIPVIVVTHNSTVGASIKPDYILFTEKRINNGVVSYKVYTGHPSSKELLTASGDSIINFDSMLNCLEGGSDAYNERRNKNYEILKN